eukprot:scaffold3051_cov236-Pinguiococcus_pyrenoidosus.AAC.5
MSGKLLDYCPRRFLSCASAPHSVKSSIASTKSTKASAASRRHERRMRSTEQSSSKPAPRSRPWPKVAETFRSASLRGVPARDMSDWWAPCHSSKGIKRAKTYLGYFETADDQDRSTETRAPQARSKLRPHAECRRFLGRARHQLGSLVEQEASLEHRHRNLRIAVNPAEHLVSLFLDRGAVLEGPLALAMAGFAADSLHGVQERLRQDAEANLIPLEVAGRTGPHGQDLRREPRRSVGKLREHDLARSEPRKAATPLDVVGHKKTCVQALRRPWRNRWMAPGVVRDFEEPPQLTPLEPAREAERPCVLQKELGSPQRGVWDRRDQGTGGGKEGLAHVVVTCGPEGLLPFCRFAIILEPREEILKAPAFHQRPQERLLRRNESVSVAIEDGGHDIGCTRWSSYVGLRSVEKRQERLRVQSRRPQPSCKACRRVLDSCVPVSCRSPDVVGLAFWIPLEPSAFAFWTSPVPDPVSTPSLPEGLAPWAWPARNRLLPRDAALLFGDRDASRSSVCAAKSSR